MRLRRLIAAQIPHTRDCSSTGSGMGSASGMNAQKRMVGFALPGGVLVTEARGVADAATIGATLPTRAFNRGAAGFVTGDAFCHAPAIAAIS